MFPEDFKYRIAHQEYLDADALIKAFGEPSPVSVRVNQAKWDMKPRNSVIVPWCDQGWYLETRPSFTLDPLFHSGCYYPQEASGMFLEQVYKQLVSETENIRVLDLCGAPGGKSTHLSSLIGDNGLLVANEVIRSRAGILAENITKWGGSNTIVTNNDPSAFSELEEYFDLILIDAPCSGEGMFRDHSVRKEWSPENAALCSERQKRIILDAWPSLKGNGILVYSTCTFNPAENEEIIKWLSEMQDAQPIMLDISHFEGIVKISHKGITGYGFYPGKIEGDGLFLAVVRKPGNSDKEKKLHLKKNENLLTGSERKIAGDLITRPQQNLYRHDDIVYDLALPAAEYLFLKNYLRIIKGGTALFKSRKDDFSPLHDLALSSKVRKDAFPGVELDYAQALSFMKKDNLTVNIAKKGWIMLTYKGINLGFVRNIGSRVNNYFPTEWRIRMNVPPDIRYNTIGWE